MTPAHPHGSRLPTRPTAEARSRSLAAEALQTLRRAGLALNSAPPPAPGTTVTVSARPK